VIGAIGYGASVVALVVAAAGALLALRERTRGGVALAARAADLAFVALLAANLLMVAALIGRDFSVAYVTQVGSRATPLLYTVASLWGALEGSILFWAVLLAGATSLLVRRTSALDRHLLPVALAVLLGLLAFFVFLIVGPGNPWARIDPPPPDGPGPNPLLQNHPLMAFHPPLLYVAFVGLAVPYAITIAALIERRLDGRWLFAARRWTLGSWIFLTLGLLAGSWWSYSVLGWGGYWAWDPVENVALLPWLTSTAFLHSAMVQARRGNLRTWNLALVVASFLLTILATLVTRSGILNSVHSFTESQIGPLFLALLAVLLVGTITAAVLRTPERGTGRAGGSTRTSAFLLNNLVLVAIAATVLTGTLFPLFVEAASGAQVSVGAPYFERVVGPLALALIVLVGIGPSLPWDGWDAAARRRLLPGALAAALAALGVSLQSGQPALVLGASAGTFALVQSAWYMIERIAGRDGRTTSGRWLERLRARRRGVGGLVIHAALALIALAVVLDASGRTESIVILRTGERATLAGNEIQFAGFRRIERPDRSMLVGDVAVGGQRTARAAPALSGFPNAARPIATPAILAGPASDLYVVLLDAAPDTGTATLRVMIRPLVSWIWPAGMVAALGGLLAFWPAARRSIRQPPPVRPVPVSALRADP